MRTEVASPVAGNLREAPEVAIVSPRKPRVSKVGAQVSVRLEPELMERIDELVPRVKRDPALGAVAPWDRSALLRYAIRLGLDAVAERLQKPRRGSPKG